MTNLIEKAIQDIAPGYEPTREQRQQIEQVENPEQVAKFLPDRVDSLREGFARDMDVTVDALPLHPFLSVIDFSSPGYKGYGGAVGSFVMTSLGRADNFTLGRTVGRYEADPLTAIYRAVLKREPDAEGLAYWRGVYEDGLPLSEVIRHFENSPEATATS